MTTATAAAAAAATVPIKAIDASAIHRIQSGQVIVNLCSVAKELVENSLDAGATSIEVRFKNQGLDAIEVQDNGGGIAPANYANVALKHYTSKLSSYDDLDTLQTFGFRGEALSSLCALSRFTVTTCLAADVPRATRLTFEPSGRLGGTSIVAAPAGTTVVVENLFWNLPVRRRELERNIKREWTKVVTLLNQYACIQTGVKFTVSQQPTKGKRVVLFATRGNTATRDNIINVFGAKTLAGLIPLNLTLELAPTTATTAGGIAARVGASSARAAVHQEIHVRGFVSRPAHGQGRQTPDRQMFYVNGRPCKLPQFAQLFGEVYRSYNASQSPFIFADLQLDTHLYDVNVSPDKQTILLHDQGRMLDNLRESLIELFEKQDITVPTAQLAPALNRAAFTTSKQRLTSIPSTPTPMPTPTIRASSRAAGSKTKSASPPAQEAGDAQLGDSDEDLGDDVAPTAAHTAEASASAPPPPPPSEETPKENEREPETDLSPSPSSPASGQPSPGSPPRKRPLRDSVATVTVGDKTVTTSLLGSGTSAKRPRIDYERGSGSSSRMLGSLQPTQKTKDAQTIKRKAKAPMPSFGGRLTQMFAAGRSAAGADAGNDDDDDDDDDDDEDDDDDAEGSSAGEDETNSQGVTGEDEEDGSGNEDAEDIEVDDEQDDKLETVRSSEEEQAPVDDQDAGDTEDAIDEEGVPIRSEAVPMKGALVGDGRVAPSQDEEGEDGEEGEEAGEAGEEEQDEGAEQKEEARLHASEDAETEEARRTRLFLKAGGSKKRHETLRLVQVLQTDEAQIRQQAEAWRGRRVRAASGGSRRSRSSPDTAVDSVDAVDAVDASTAEEKLSLTITKSDFAAMRVVGQFNLGFVLAVREGAGGDDPTRTTPQHSADDELFIVDQHASDEKYNFERLQASTVVQSQRLVQPKQLDLTAVEEEIVLEHQAALAANGFTVEVDLGGDDDECQGEGEGEKRLPVVVGRRCRLLTLPLSRETTFDLSDLEELIALLGGTAGSGDGTGTGGGHGCSSLGSHSDHGLASAIPRPAKVRKMFAMRACRSSIMIGRALSRRQMAGVLRHMGAMDKPWNCPHGRPTMRHLCSLGRVWDTAGRTWAGDRSDDDDNNLMEDTADGTAGDASVPMRRRRRRLRDDPDWRRFLAKRRRAAAA